MTKKQAQPFLKWAGGKTQLLRQIESFFPEELRMGSMTRYVEPFVGGGAVFFKVANIYPIREFIISDINPELILAYQTIQKEVEGLITHLWDKQETYLALPEDE
ncbi:MAG: DNA adenine methylase, partial [Halothece sp. Uz-M2-17]|nr:DNA adenine methylase [Halothece sp. Uz-M2-17]